MDLALTAVTCLYQYLPPSLQGSDLTRKVTEDGLEEQFQVGLLNPHPQLKAIRRTNLKDQHLTLHPPYR